MRTRWLIALFLVLVFPAIGFGIAAGAQAKLQGDVNEIVRQELGRELTADEQTRLDIVELCKIPEASSDDACRDVAIAGLTRGGAIAAAVIGLLLLAFVAFCSSRARTDRAALLRLFRPGLYVTLAGVAILVALDGLLALSSVYLGLGVFAGRIYPVIILGIGIGVVLGVAGVVRAMVGATRRAASSAIARRLDPAEAPEIHELVAALASRLGTLPPENVLVGLDPEFYVTEAEIAATDGRWQGRNLYLSLPLLRILTPGELRAVLGHELGHFRGSDTEYSHRFYPIYRGTGEALARLDAAGRGSGYRAIAVLPAFLVLTLFFEGFAVAERAISRDRELAADQVGAEGASGRDLATALVKLLAFTKQWETVTEELPAAVFAGKPAPANLGDRFVELVRSAASPEALAGLDERELPHPTDSHPALSRRLDALGFTQAELAEAALQVAPEPAADAIAPHRAELEQELTAWIEARVKAIASARAGIVAPAS